MLAFALLAVSVAAAPPIVRGAKGGIGEVHLKDTDLALEKAGFKKGGLPGWYEKDRLRAQTVDGVVTQVSYTLVRDELDALAGKKDATVEDLALKLGRCGPNEAREGGNWLPCFDGLALADSMGGVEVRILAKGDLPKASCDDYVRPGVATTMKPRLKYCLQERVLSSELTLAEVEKDASYGACETVKDGDRSRRRCRELHLVFGGPKKQLQAIEYKTPSPP